MNNELTEIVIVLDRSGSMRYIKDDMEGALDQFFDDQKKEPGRCLVTLTQFSDSYEIVYSGIDLKQVPKTLLLPMGSTALLDAIGRTILAVGERLTNTPEPERPGKVIFLIITDGQENASKGFSRDQIKNMIREQTDKYSWLFVYLGANQDAFAEAATMGILYVQGYQANSVGTRAVIGATSTGVSNYRKGKGYN